MLKTLLLLGKCLTVVSQTKSYDDDEVNGDEYKDDEYTLLISHWFD